MNWMKWSKKEPTKITLCIINQSTTFSVNQSINQSSWLTLKWCNVISRWKKYLFGIPIEKQIHHDVPRLVARQSPPNAQNLPSQQPPHQTDRVRSLKKQMQSIDRLTQSTSKYVISLPSNQSIDKAYVEAINLLEHHQSVNQSTQISIKTREQNHASKNPSSSKQKIPPCCCTAQQCPRNATANPYWRTQSRVCWRSWPPWWAGGQCADRSPPADAAHGTPSGFDSWTCPAWNGPQSEWPPCGRQTSAPPAGRRAATRWQTPQPGPRWRRWRAPPAPTSPTFSSN